MAGIGTIALARRQPQRPPSGEPISEGLLAVRRC
jgi:hypothetical protein